MQFVVPRERVGAVSRLFLLRHAKAAWALPGMRDFDRPLDAAGLADAEATGISMQAHGYIPELTLCSNAVRARQTLEGIAANADTGRVLYFDDLYREDASGYLSIIRKSGNVGTLMVIGHNPMMEDLALALAPQGDEDARATLHAGFPTSGLAVLRFPGNLSEAVPGTGYLEAILMPPGL
jgi:phosphohistidine phosphatase